MLEHLARNWQVVLFRGVVAVLAGIVAILWPGITLLSLVLVYGVFTLADGLTALWLGFKTRREGKLWGEMLLLGILAILAGLIAIFWPGLTSIFFVYLIGFAAIFRGVFEIAAAIQLRKAIDDEWMLILSGVLSLLFGILLIARPGAGAIALVLLIGAFMIAVGSVEIGLALRLRQIHRRRAATPAVEP